MAKDAKGHGSDGRGSMSVPDRHQHNIAVDTVKNPMKGVFLGGPSAAEAEATLRGKFGYSDSAISSLKGEDKAAAGALANGHPKSAAVPVHEGASGRGPDMSDFVKKMQSHPGPYNEAEKTASGKRSYGRGWRSKTGTF